MSKKRQTIKKIAAEYRTVLEKLGIHVEKIVLFGSYAYGQPTKSSDIDLLVISNDFKKLNLRERLELLGLATAKMSVLKPIEALGYTNDEIKKITRFSFLSEALAHGITL